MRKGVFGALGSLLLLALPSLSSAVPMNWTYSGTCSWGCEESLSITGSLWADPENYASDTQINEYALFGDLIGFSFTIGDYEFSGNAGAGTYLLDATGNIVGGSMTFANLFALEFLEVGNATWSILDKDCHWFKCNVAFSAGGEGGYTYNPTSVPEPGTLGLFGLALLGVGAATRRRKRAVK